MSKYKHTENEAKVDWDYDTLINERIDCLKAISMYKIPKTKTRYELRQWSDLPINIKNKLRHLFDNSFYD